MKRLAQNKKTLASVLVVAALLATFAFLKLTSHVRSTENAYINADVVEVASLVPGRVIAVYVKDNQRVKKGEALFDVDPEPFRIELARAEADLAMAMQTSRQDSAEVAASRAQVE